MQPRCLLVLLPLLACDSGSDVEPKSGTWTYSNSEVVANTCGTDPPTDPNGTFTLTVSGEGKFTVVDEAFDGTFDCTFSDGSYSCPRRLASEITLEGVSATAKLNASISGSLESATALTGTQDVNVDCEGDSCAILASMYSLTLPCAYSFTFSAAAQ
jgi:hypothetical protein